jgi:HprK-related kinase A
MTLAVQAPLTVSSLGPAGVRTRLGSAAGLAFRTGPVAVRVRSRIGGVADSMVRLYAEYPLLTDRDFTDFDVEIGRPAGLRGWWRRQVTFGLDGQRPFNPLAGNQGFPLFEWGLNWCVYGMCHQYLILHAAVLEKGGRALLLPAPSGSGKSTLCAALALSGWRLLSDELALIDPANGHVVPMPRPVSVKNQSIDVLSRLFPQLAFGSRVEETVKGVVAHFAAPAAAVHRAMDTARPAWVVLPRWVQGSAVVATPLARARGFMALVENAFNYDVFGRTGFELLADVVERSDCFAFEYGHLPEALAWFEQRAREAADGGR